MSVSGELVGATSARRRRERRLRSWWRHEALSVAAALATARHHSSGPGMMTRREVQQEEECPTGTDATSSGTRPEQLLATPGPQAAVTVGYVAAGALSLVVAPVASHSRRRHRPVPPRSCRRALRRRRRLRRWQK